MKFSYQIGTPDLKISHGVTCMQGDFRENIQRLASYGYDSIEIMTTYPKSVDWEWVKACLDERHMGVSLICSGELGLLGYTISHPDDAVREQSLKRIEELIDLAAFFEVGINIGNTKGRYIDHVPKAVVYERAADGLRRLCDYAAPKNVTIAVETGAFVYINFLNTCAEAAEMIQAVGRDNLGIMLDLWHLYIEEKSVVEAIKEYAPMCYHVHLADSNRMYPGAGNFDYAGIINTFHESGYNGAFSVEVRQVPDSHTAAREAARTLVPEFNKIYQANLTFNA